MDLNSYVSYVLSGQRNDSPGVCRATFESSSGTSISGISTWLLHQCCSVSVWPGFSQNQVEFRVFGGFWINRSAKRDDRDADGPVLLESQLGGEQWSWFYWKKLAGNVGCVDSQWWERDFVSCCIVILYLMPIAPSSTSLLSHGSFFGKPKWLSPCKCQRPFFFIPIQCDGVYFFHFLERFRGCYSPLWYLCVFEEEASSRGCRRIHWLHLGHELGGSRRALEIILRLWALQRDTFFVHLLFFCCRTCALFTCLTAKLALCTEFLSSWGKGIGFKSVFTVSDRAHVLSKDWSIEMKGAVTKTPVDWLQ